MWGEGSLVSSCQKSGHHVVMEDNDDWDGKMGAYSDKLKDDGLGESFEITMMHEGRRYIWLSSSRHSLGRSSTEFLERVLRKDRDA